MQAGKNIIDVQYAIEAPWIPGADQLSSWANAALGDRSQRVELTIRIVDEKESADLHQRWLNMTGATNVMSFPAEVNIDMEPSLLGDVVICAPVIAMEAKEQGKPVDAHFAHMVVHGTLHLLGYDHIEEEQANSMESLEIDILESLDIDNPYN